MHTVRQQGITNLSTWIFQGNPDRFDIDEYLKNATQIYWSVTRKSYESRISLGDRVFIWRAMGKQRTRAGIVAIGEIIENPVQRSRVKSPRFLGSNLWVRQQDDPTVIKTGVLLSETRLTLEEGMLPAELVAVDEILGDLQIVKSRQGTNFLLSEGHAERLVELWRNGSDPFDDIRDGDFSVPEGRVKLAVHRSRERNPALRRRAISSFKAIHGNVYCEVCSFSFQRTYGELGEGYIEVHHKKPLHEIEPGEVTRVSDLLLVCSNCHSVLHRGDPAENLLRLNSLFSGRG